MLVDIIVLSAMAGLLALKLRRKVIRIKTSYTCIRCNESLVREGSRNAPYCVECDWMLENLCPGCGAPPGECEGEVYRDV